MNSSFFKGLQSLASTPERSQEEDFFTEVIAGFFRSKPSLVLQWLQACDVPVTESEAIFIDTQVEYGKQEDTLHPRRPDMRIQVVEKSGGRHVVLVESKLGSTEGHMQLRDYARILSSRCMDASSRTVLYVTRNFDPKEEQKGEILRGLRGSPVGFQQARWHELYQLIRQNTRQATPDYFGGQVQQFMEELGMATTNQFQPEDILALKSLSGAMSLVKEVLHSEVEVEFRDVLGIEGGKRPPSDQLVKKQRYTLRHYATHLHVMLGFFVDRGGSYPTLGLILEVYPGSTDEPGLFSELHRIRQESVWDSKDLDSEAGWSGIVKEKNLRHFMPENDQVKAMKDYCLGLMSELRKIRDEHPDWFGVTADTPDEEVD